MKWLVYGVVSLLLTVIWLILNESLSLGQVVLGLGVSLSILWGIAKLNPRRLQIKRLRPMIGLFFIVAYDVLISNRDVFLLIWKGKHSRHQPGFIHIPLDISHPHALAALACIVTYTPGTVLAHISAQDGLILHILDMGAEASWVNFIKTRYEQRLMEIFE